MHELSIAAAVLDQLEAELAKHPGARFSKVGLRIGELAGVDADALSFGFEAMIKDTHWDPLALEIEHVTRRQYCRKCDLEFSAANYETACPKCGEIETKNVAGDELQVAYIEVED